MLKLLLLISISIFAMGAVARGASAYDGEIMVRQLPCFHIVEWLERNQREGFQAVDSRVDSDGNNWVIWERDRGFYWRTTVSVPRAKFICLLGNDSATQKPPS